MKKFLVLFTGVALLAGCATLGGQANTPSSPPQQASQYPPAWTPIIYPNRGQTPQQEDTDKHQCYIWSKQTSGFDPMAPVQAPPPPTANATKAAAKGAAVGGAGGALGGLAIGSLFGKAGAGAAIGAIAGGLIGGIMRKEQVDKEKAAQEQRANQQAAAYQEKRNTYNRAFTACMEGKGYTVK
jgi:hypothetical protein